MNWHDFEGQAILAGIELEKLDGAQMVNLCYTSIINDITNFETSRSEARKIIDERLDDLEIQYNLKKGVKPEPEPFVLSPAMMAQMGIPIHRPGAAQ